VKHSVGLFSVLIFILAIVHFPYTATTTQELNTIVTPSISSGTAYIPTQDQVHSVVWSPDGSMIAISGGIAGCDDVDTSQFAIRIFNASTEEIFKNLDGMTCTSTFLDWSPDRQKLASLNSAQAVVYIWDISAESSF
jgi:WD40 repeat protein